MDKNSFLEAMASSLGVPVAQLNDAYELVWESMLVLEVITLLSQHYNVTLEVDDLMRCKNIGQLCQITHGRRLAA